MSSEVRDIGSRRELLLDDWLIETLAGARLQLHQPVAQEISLHTDRPWEGNTCCYVTMFQDEGLYRMYYRGSHFDWTTQECTHQVVCYAQSDDGIHWTRPDLGLFDFEGCRANNIVWRGAGEHNFSPFKDLNPAAPPEARYKAIGGDEGGLVAFQSADALRWSLIQKTPVITQGAFDSQNLAFWDALRGEYVEYHRGIRDGVRDIMVCRSQDFLHWTEPEWVDFGDAPHEHLYTNATVPYVRAPHIYVGFPKRFLPERKRIDRHPYPGVSDGVLMSSRDGVRFQRRQEGFLRPGPQENRWWERNNMIAWGLVTTRSALPGAADELSLYATEGHYEDVSFRRFTLRLDGFVSVHADFSPGEMLTRPLVFSGTQLRLNYATSAAGSIRAELQDADGEPLPGFELRSSPELYGDEVDGLVRWEGEPDLGALAGRPVRLRFVLQDADVYALRFCSEED